MLTCSIFQHLYLVVLEPIVYLQGLSVNMPIFSVTQDSSVGQQQLISGSESGHHYLIGSDFSSRFFLNLLFIFILFFFLFFDNFFGILIRFILPLLVTRYLTINIIPFSICFFTLSDHLFIVLCFLLLRFFFVVNNNFHLLERDAKGICISFLLLKLLFEQWGEIVVIFILFESFLGIHECMIFREHMFSNSFSCSKVFGSFVVAEDAHHTNLNFLL